MTSDRPMIDHTTIDLGYGCWGEISRQCVQYQYQRKTMHEWYLPKFHKPDGTSIPLAFRIDREGAMSALERQLDHWKAHNHARVAIWNLVHHSNERSPTDDDYRSD